MGVEEDEFFDALAGEGVGDVGDDLEEGGGGDGDGDGAGDLEEVGVDAEGDGGEEQDVGALAVGVFDDVPADDVGLEDVGAVGEVEVVRLGGAEGEDGDVPLFTADVDSARMQVFMAAPEEKSWNRRLTRIDADERRGVRARHDGGGVAHWRGGRRW